MAAMSNAQIKALVEQSVAMAVEATRKEFTAQFGGANVSSPAPAPKSARELLEEEYAAKLAALDSSPVTAPTVTAPTAIATDATIHATAVASAASTPQVKQIDTPAQPNGYRKATVLLSGQVDGLPLVVSEVSGVSKGGRPYHNITIEHGQGRSVHDLAIFADMARMLQLPQVAAIVANFAKTADKWPAGKS